MQPREIFSARKLELTIARLSYEIVENHGDFKNSCLIGVQPRGVYFSERIARRISESLEGKSIPHGKLDVTFYRDDFRRREKLIMPRDTLIPFSIENKRVILVDDVLYTGRTIRAAFDALLDFGRPAKVELLVLVDRRFSRQFPIEPSYVGQTIDTITEEEVKVEWKENEGKDRVFILSKE